MGRRPRWRLVLVGALLFPAAAAPLAIAAGVNNQACRRADNVVARTDGWTSIRPPANLAALKGATPDPDTFGRIYAFNATTVERTDDGGCSWSTVFNAPATTTAGRNVARSQITDVEVAGGVWVTTATTARNVGAGTIWYEPNGANSFSYASAGMPLGGTVMQLLPTEQPGRAYALVQTLAGPQLYASSLQAGTTVTWQSHAVPNFIKLTAIAVDPHVPEVVNVASPYAYARSLNGGTTFPIEKRVPGRITAVDAGGASLDIYLASGRLLSVAGRTTTIAAPGGVIGATHVTQEPSVRAVSTRYGDYGYDPTKHRWLQITPLGLVAQHLKLASPTLPPVLYGTAGKFIFELPLRFPAAFVTTAPPLQPGQAISLHGVSAFGQHPPTLAPGPQTITLRPGAHRSAHYLLRVPAQPGPIDVDFLVDTTNSMLPAISGLRHGMQQIVAALGRRTPNLEVGLADFRDFDDGEEPTTDNVCHQFVPQLLNHQHHLYVLDQRIAPVGSGLAKALGQLSDCGGGDVPEADTIAVMQALTGAGVPGWVAPGQEAGFRPNATKVIVLITDSPMHLGAPYPSMTTTVDALRAYGVNLVGINIDDGIEQAIPDLRALAAGSHTLAPPGGVACQSHGQDVPAGAPMVCSVPVTGAGIAVLAGPVARLIEQVDAAGVLSAHLHSATAGYASFVGPSQAAANLHRTSRLPVTVDFRCPISAAGSTHHIGLSGAVGNTTVARTSVVLNCLPTPAAAVPPPVALVAAAVAAPPPPPPPITSNINPNVNPGTGAATQEEQQSQLAVAELNDQPGSAPAVNDNGPDMGAPMLYAAALLMTGAAALALRLRARPEPVLARARRTR